MEGKPKHQIYEVSGKPVFHAIDPTWGMDNGVNFNFIPENEAEARMFIAESPFPEMQ